MKVIFMGTPDFAVGTLQAIIDSPHEVVAVVTQPDKEKGRGKAVQFTPVKICALAHDIPVLQPKRIKDVAAIEELRAFEADIFVVAAFGQILSKEILDMPKYGCICVHASLLPKYRGAAPIQWAILNGEKESGVTIMQMDEGIDTGDMILKTIVPITKTETGDSLHDKLAVAGAALCVEVLDIIEAGYVTLIPQNNNEATHTKMLTKGMGHIRFEHSAVKIERMIRGLNSWPSAYAILHDKVLKIWRAGVTDRKSTGAPGTIAEVTKQAIFVNTGDFMLEIKELQLEGKKRMCTAYFLLGYQIAVGEQLN